MYDLGHTDISRSIIVDDSSKLQDCIQQVGMSKTIAIDTEFIRTNTFFPILALVQIFDGKNCWLIDPTCINDLSPLKGLLINDRILKVFHSCSEDIEVLSNSFGCCPQPIFDTQVAAALSGFGFSIGYASLADKILGVHVDKGETRSNWLMRPLSKSQLGYAALDVIHLLPIYIEIEKRLIQLGRKDWIDEEMSRLVKESSIKEEPNQYFRRVKGAGRLGLDELSTLQMICEWREKEAKIKDKPRSRILSDRTIIELVSKTPKSKKELFEIEGMHPILVKKYSGKLLDLIQDGLAVPKNKRPKPIAEPLPRHAGSLIKKLMKIVNIQAESLDLAPEILARRRDIEYLVRSITADGCTKLPEKIAKGWRYNVIGLPLLASSSDLV